jgi:hypothetical protein
VNFISESVLSSVHCLEKMGKTEFSDFIGAHQKAEQENHAKNGKTNSEFKP